MDFAWLGEIDTAYIALFGTVFGGAGLKIIEKWLASGTTKSDAEAKFRDELRTDNQTMRENLRTAEKETDEWKLKYFMLMQKYFEEKERHNFEP